MHHCHPGAYFSPSFCSALLHYSYFSNIFVVVIKLFLSQPTGFTFFFFFLILFPVPLGEVREVGKLLHGT